MQLVQPELLQEGKPLEENRYLASLAILHNNKADKGQWVDIHLFELVLDLAKQVQVVLVQALLVLVWLALVLLVLVWLVPVLLVLVLLVPVLLVSVLPVPVFLSFPHQYPHQH
ncbi:hypothetical protein SAFG77S_13573 [Streptomyces afghaniensis]